jgi:hypothetical protein
MFLYQSGGQWNVTTNLGPDESGELTIISMTGQRLWSEDVTGSNKYVIDPVVPAGFYLLNLAYTGGNDTQKILMSGR